MAGLVVSVGPVAGGEPLPEQLVDGLFRSADDLGQLNIHTADTAPVSAGPEALAEWFAPLERAGERHILLVRDAQATPDWARFAETRSDSRFRVGRLDAPPPAPQPDTLAVNPRDHLVLWRPTATTPINGSAAWLAGRDIEMHHHLALDHPGDFARLLRFARDRAVGVVLAGGGAFGTAHVGALRAMSEAGIPVGALRGFLFKRSRKNRFPRIPSILSRSMIINSRRETGRMDMGRDILVKLPTAPRANFLDWTKGQQNYEIGHQALATALAETDPVAAPDVRMRDAARRMAEIDLAG